MRVGYLQQEPVLDGEKTVYENVMEGVKHKTELLEKFDQISAKVRVWLLGSPFMRPDPFSSVKLMLIWMPYWPSKPPFR